MTKKPKSKTSAAAPSHSEAHVPVRRQGLEGTDIAVLLAMAILAVAIAFALHIQAGLAGFYAALIAAGAYVLLALSHVQKMRIERLRDEAELPSPAQIPRAPAEPSLMASATNDAALDVQSRQLAAAAAALREAPATARKGFGLAPQERQMPQLSVPDIPAEVPQQAREAVDHGWGSEPDAVDALVRQYAKDLDRGDSQRALIAASVPQPNLAVGATGQGTAPEAATAGTTPLTAALRKAADGDLEIYLQPVVAFADRKARLYEVFPRILDSSGRAVGALEYHAEAASAGLSLAIERSALVRCAAIQRKLSDRGRARAMIFRLSSAAIRDRAFIERLIVDINPDPLLADLVLFEIDQAEIDLGDGIEDNMALLARAGFRFSLGFADTLALEVAELTARHIAFVRITPSILSNEQNPAVVTDLRQGGIEAVLTAVQREEDVRIGRAFGLVLGQGPLFSEAKPLRSDIAAAGGAVAPPPKRGSRNRAA